MNFEKHLWSLTRSYMKTKYNLKQDMNHFTYLLVSELVKALASPFNYNCIRLKLEKLEQKA